MRQLPGRTAEGKRVYVDCERGGAVDRVADRVEKTHLEDAREVLDLARASVSIVRTNEELRFVAERTIEALANVLDVAEQRGERLA